MATDITEKPVDGAGHPNQRRPNAAMLAALAEIAEIHKGMNPKEHATDSIEYLREAREGAMYGDEAASSDT